jgi:DNA polymerase-3 subunit epsilon
MRQIVLDTETTGLNPGDGHRIIEIGCVELLNRKLTGGRFHVYLNPEREIDQGAVDVHGLDNKFLADKPRFEEVARDFFAFVQGAELIIHNAPFDVGFINAELRRLQTDWLDENRRAIGDWCEILDTLALARKKHPGQRNSLDALCKRYNVDNSHRDLHGALLDAEILADVYLAMTGGQASLSLEPEADERPRAGQESVQSKAKGLGERPRLKVIRCSEAELAEHETRLSAIDKASGQRCVWRRSATT